MKKKILLFLIAATSCGPAKETTILSVSTPLPESENVEIIGTTQQVPSSAKLLGHLKIGDSGMSAKCSYDIVISEAQKQARGMGGNLFKITKHRPPNIWSTCHRLEGEVYLAH